MANPNPDTSGLIPNKGQGVPNAGAKPSALRAKMRGSLATRIKIAEEIADDENASNADRLRALDFLAKYGVGTKQTINVADIPTAELRALLEEEGEDGAGEEGGE